MNTKNCGICKCAICATCDCDGTWCLECTAPVAECFNYRPKEPDQLSPDGQLSSPEIATMHQDGTLCESCGAVIGEPVGEPRLCEGCEDSDPITMDDTDGYES